MDSVSSIPRRRTRQIMVGSVPIGGDAPIAVATRVIATTADVEATLRQIYALAAAGADMVRCSCIDLEAAQSLEELVPRSPVPIVADVYHRHELGLAALEAGVHCLGLTPGDIRDKVQIKVVAQECKDRSVPVQISVDGGSLDKSLCEKYGGRVSPEALVESTTVELSYLAAAGFVDVMVSVKAPSLPLTIEAFRQLSETIDQPLHLGAMESGSGLLKATAGIATLLAVGIGDAIRYPLTSEPVEEAHAGRELLEVMGLRQR